jgi:ribonuclease III
VATREDSKASQTIFRDLKELEEILGVTFADKGLLQQSLVHRSFLNENPDFPLGSNERLEFLGDAILGFVVAKYAYSRYPELSEGELTSLRAALVNKRTLAIYARSIGLGEHLYLGRGEVASGGRSREAILAAGLEAVLGAILLDQGVTGVEGFLDSWLRQEAHKVIQRDLDRDYKSRFQELVQQRFHMTPTYRTLETSGPDHAKEFVIEARVSDRIIGQGRGRSKQAAQQEAARAALAILLEEGESASSDKDQPEGQK